MHDDTIRRGFRPDIQGLRAIAVLLVIVYHLYPNRVTGGFIGVDVFFVLSGYLITSHLHREVASTDRLSLSRFWARRIRRLLPASLLVLALSALATALWVPRTMWEQTLRQIAASALYVENWALAREAVDYSALGNSPTLVQHYWSLSVEEQFYLLWPVLVVGCLFVAHRFGLRSRPVLAVVIAAVGLASYVYSITETSSDGARAYFVTPTRVWEFAAGALLALVVSEDRATSRRNDTAAGLALGWTALVAVVWSGLALSDTTPFPGWVAAIPVAGTAALIATGAHGSRYAVGRLLGLRPFTVVGDISYSMYLWHWPMVVVLPYITGVDLRTRDKVAIFVATIVVSWACTRWVEDPLRGGRLLTLATWRPYAFGAAGMVVVVALSATLRSDLTQDVQQAANASAQVVDRALSGQEPCIGPAALHPDPPGSCHSVAGSGAPILDPASVADETRHLAFPGCMAMQEEAEVHTCDLGTTHHPTRTIAVVGDSHVTHWFPAFDTLGKERGWTFRTYTRSGCPFTDARHLRKNWPAERYKLCWDGNDEVERRLLADPDIDTVFVSADSSSYGWAQPPGGHLKDPATDGFRAVWNRLTDAGKQVLVIRDVPETKGHRSGPDCLAENADHPNACANTRAAGLARDVEADAVQGAAAGVHLIDLSDQFCDDRLCYARIGNVIAYRDFGHISDEYSTLLAPYLGAAFDRVDAHRRPSSDGR